jgi:hypothetical protein
MDTIAHDLRAIRSRVAIPTSVPGLVTDRMLVMQYLDGVPLTQLGSKMAGLSAAERRMGLKRVRRFSSQSPWRALSCLLREPSARQRVLQMRRLWAGDAVLVRAGHHARVRGIRPHDPRLWPVPGGWPPWQHPRDEGRPSRARRLWAEQAAGQPRAARDRTHGHRALRVRRRTVRACCVCSDVVHMFF